MPVSRRISLTESMTYGEIHRLTTEEATLLSAQGLVEVRPEGGERWRLVPGRAVGAVRVGDV
jgi:hypothetical protein